MTTMIRKLTSAFGNLFKDIQIYRFNQDGSEQERFLVPIQYAGKEKYVARLQGDPQLDKKVQYTLPSMSFEMTNMQYDANRKQITNIKNFSRNSSGAVVSQYNPVPYNFNFDLYIYVRNEEDGHQIVERILPFFTPDYTIKINMVPELGEIRELPITLNAVDRQRDYEGSFETQTRLIIWTLSFTVRGLLFGATNEPKLITHSITNILTKLNSGDEVVFTMNPVSGTGNYQANEFVYQGFTLDNSTASGIVKYWNNNKLTLTNLDGNFISNVDMVGSLSGAHYKFSSYNVTSSSYARIDIYGDVSMDNQSNVHMDNMDIHVDNTDTTDTIITEN